MKPMKFKRFEIRPPRWNNYNKPTVTDNGKWGNQGLFIVFEDYFGNEFDWMPKWNEIKELNDKKNEVEAINKKLCKEYMEKLNEL